MVVERGALGFVRCSGIAMSDVVLQEVPRFRFVCRLLARAVATLTPQFGSPLKSSRFCGERETPLFSSSLECFSVRVYASRDGHTQNHRLLIGSQLGSHSLVFFHCPCESVEMCHVRLGG